LIRTTSERPFSKFVTRASTGMGKVGWAALIAFMSKISPFAVGLP
jgi:hypothetical protein